MRRSKSRKFNNLNLKKLAFKIDASDNTPEDEIPEDDVFLGEANPTKPYPFWKVWK